MTGKTTFADFAKLTPHTRQAALERQDSSCTYITHHELESVNSIITITFIIITITLLVVIVTIIVTIIINIIIIILVIITIITPRIFLCVCSQGLQCEGRTSEWALYIPHRKRKRPFSCWMAWVGTLSVVSSTAAANALASCSMYLRSRLSAYNTNKLSSKWTNT